MLGKGSNYKANTSYSSFHTHTRVLSYNLGGVVGERDCRFKGAVVGAHCHWDEGNMVHAMRRFGGTTVGWRFGDG